MKRSGALCAVPFCELVEIGQRFCARHSAMLPRELQHAIDDARHPGAIGRRLSAVADAVRWILAHEHAPMGRPAFAVRLVDRIITGRA